MKLRKFAIFGISLCLCAVTLLFYSRALIHGGVFRQYLLNNAVLVCSLSLTLLGLRYLGLRLAQSFTSTITRWLILWISLGLGLPILLYPLDKFAMLDIGEPLLFTLWPTYIMFLAGDGSWSDPLLVPLSLAVNATIYVGQALLVWWLVNYFQGIRRTNANA